MSEKKFYIDRKKINELMKTDLSTAAILGKLVTSEKTGFKSDYGTETSYISSLDKSSDNCDMSSEFIKLFPDLKIAIEIITTLMLSPKDTNNVELIYRVNDVPLSPDLSASLLNIIKDYMEKEYRLTDNLHIWLKELFMGSGSVVTVIIPENSLDDIINGNTKVSEESISDLMQGTSIRPMGILGSGDTKSTALESLLNISNGIKPIGKDTLSVEDLNIDITDNINILKLPKILKAHQKQRVASALGTGLENIIDNDIDVLYKDTVKVKEPELTIPLKDEASRRTIGKPLTMVVDNIAIIRIFVPGDVREQIGGFIVIDEDGNPITKYTKTEDTALSEEDALAHKLNATVIGKSIIEKASTGLSAMTNDDDKATPEDAARLYYKTVERAMINRLQSGIYNRGLIVGKNDPIYRLMLSRTLADKQTRLVFVPNELLSYIAMDFDEVGRGKNILQDINVLSSMRAALMFSGVVSDIKSNIPQTKVKLTIDERETDISKTIAVSVAEVLKTSQMEVPIGLSSPSDFVAWAHKSGFQFSFDGHPSIPQTKFEFSDASVDRGSRDNTTIEDIRKQQLMWIGVTPEIVDNGFTTDYASTAEANRVLMSKRIKSYQTTFTNDLRKHVSKLVLNDGTLLSELWQIVKSNENIYDNLPDEDKSIYKKDKNKYLLNVLNNFIESIMIDLPSPDNNSMESKANEFSTYRDALEDAIEFWVSDILVTGEDIGDLADRIDDVKEAIKSYYLRKWMLQEGYLPELSQMVTLNGAGDPTIELGDIMSAHLEGLVKTTSKYLENTKALKEELEGDDTDDDTSSGYDEGDSNDDEDDTDSTDDDDGGSTDDDKTDDDDNDSDDTTDDDTGKSDDEDTDTEDTKETEDKKDDDDDETFTF